MCFFSASHIVATKVIYTNHPDLKPMELVALRQTGACLVILLWLNTTLKQVAWQNLTRDIMPTMSIKSLQFCATVTVNMINVKNFPLTTVAMSNNCAPFLTMIMAFICLPSDTPASKLEFSATVIAVIGATLVV